METDAFTRNYMDFILKSWTANHLQNGMVERYSTETFYQYYKSMEIFEHFSTSILRFYVNVFFWQKLVIEIIRWSKVYRVKYQHQQIANKQNYLSNRKWNAQHFVQSLSQYLNVKPMLYANFFRFECWVPLFYIWAILYTESITF